MDKKNIEEGRRCTSKILHEAMDEAKRRSGLTQTDIANRLGKWQPNVSRVERGANVSFKAFSDYLAACGFGFTLKIHPVRKGREKPDAEASGPKEGE